jgi:hypothetical protein
MRTGMVTVWCTWILAILGCAVLLEMTSRASDGPFSFSSVDVPGATLTQASGINAGGDIVGAYVDAKGRHGFVLSGGAFTSIDFPTSDPTNPVIGTDARGIGPGGDIVGTYRLKTEPTTVPAHGYLLTRGGAFYRIDHPNHINTIAQRILPNGDILGCYHDTDTMDTMHGMTTSRGDVSAFDMGMTMHNGATPNGRRLVGLWTDSAKHGHGYLLDGDNFISFDFPGTEVVGSTAGWDINAHREAVGVYTDSNKKVHGFLVDADWHFTTIDVPNATITRVFGINSAGDVVGSYVSAGVTHGFIARRSTDD